MYTVNLVLSLKLFLINDSFDIDKQNTFYYNMFTLMIVSDLIYQTTIKEC